MNETTVIDPFENIEMVELPSPMQQRFGDDQFRKVMEFQVGTASNEDFPKVFRVNRSGQWMGQARFVTITGDDQIAGALIRYQVDMFGNITASSFKTAASGERIRILGNHMEVYDSNNIKRIDIYQDSINFFNYLGVAVGNVRGSSSGTALVVQGIDRLSLNTLTGGTKMGLDEASNTLFTEVPLDLFDIIVLAPFASDPAVTPGAIYYNTLSGKFRICLAGGWQDMGSGSGGLTSVAHDGTLSGNGTLLSPLSVVGGTPTFVDNEVVAGSTNTFTLASVPVLGTEHIYGNGQRLMPTVDYTISGAIITTTNPWPAGVVLADYRT